MKTIVCVHAHQSNIEYLEKMFSDFPCSLQHKIIELTGEIKSNSLKHKISSFFTKDTIACFLTCTVHSSLITAEVLQGIPIFRIEEPLIKKILTDDEDKLLLFTNPNTIDLTINRIKLQESSQQNYKVEVIPKAFELILKNKKEAYESAILEYIDGIASHVYLMQLSMSIVKKDSLIAKGNVLTIYEEAEKIYRKKIAALLAKKQSYMLKE